MQRELFVLSIALMIDFCWCACSSVYGAKPCPYVPSPPGEKPPCAKHSDTYCEYPEHYPKELVYHLVEKWKYNHRTLLLDEDKRDFYLMASDSVYGPPPNTIFNQQDNNNQYPYPNAVYGPPTRTYPAPNLNTYIPPPPLNRTHQQNFQSRPYNYKNGYQQFNNYKPLSSANFNRYNAPEVFKSISIPQFEGYHYGPWMKWNGRNDKFSSIRRKRDLLRKWHHLTNNNNATVTRERRQAGGGQTNNGQTLCQSRSQYIMPRAALNNKGDWMYVVNLPEVDNRYTQLVKSEVCASQQCSGLCSLPSGYSSRCEQRYVQKRLVAVEPGGSQLYSDIFWFPSCCICTITAN